MRATVKATAFYTILDGPIMPFLSPSLIPFQMFCIIHLTTNYYCSLYNNVLYLLLVMNKKHSLISLIQIKKRNYQDVIHILQSHGIKYKINSIDNF